MTPFADFTGVEPAEVKTPILTPRPTEPYLCEITAADGSQDSPGGHPQAVLQLRDVGGAGEIRDWIVFSQTSGSDYPLQKIAQLGQAAGSMPGVLETREDWNAWVAGLAGRRVAVYVGEEPSRKKPGENRTVVNGYAEPGTIADGANGGGDGERLPF